MHKELLEKGADVKNTPEKYKYQHYLKLGGIINEHDYNSALERMGNATIKESRVSQVESIKKFAKIESLNPLAIKLYEVLHSDKRPENAEHHHDEMNDQKLFREALMMLEDTDALDKMKTAYHINRPLGTRCPLCGQIQENENCP